ncbi:MAG: hypothetical protein SGPRY_006471, partial [Prymnesium sp.]
MPPRQPPNPPPSSPPNVVIFLNGSNASWDGYAYSEVLTYVTFEGGVVVAGNQALFVRRDVASCDGAANLTDDHGGLVDGNNGISFRLPGGEDFTDTGTNASWIGYAYSNVYTIVTFSGGVVQAGSEARFVSQLVGSCANANLLTSDHGTTIDALLQMPVQLEGGEDFTSSGTYHLCLAT